MGLLDALNTNNDVSCVSCHCHIESILLGTHKTRVGGFVQQQVKEGSVVPKLVRDKGVFLVREERWEEWKAIILISSFWCKGQLYFQSFNTVTNQQHWRLSIVETRLLKQTHTPLTTPLTHRPTSSGTAAHFSLLLC